MRTGAIIQARMSSTRLPGKVLKELPFGSGSTVLQQVIRRLMRVKGFQEIIVATTEEEMDTEIVRVAEKEGVQCFRGSRDDVLERFYLAAQEHSLDLIVRVTSDCPCLDPEIIELLIRRHRETGADYTSNCLVRSLPHGLDAEAVSFSALEKAQIMAGQPFEREHVTPFIYKTRPEMFTISSLETPDDLRAPDIRITLDTEEDYALLCAVFDYLYEKAPFFGTREIIALFSQKPWLRLINKKIMQKKIFSTLREELKEIVAFAALQDLMRAKTYLGNVVREMNPEALESPER